MIHPFHASRRRSFLERCDDLGPEDDFFNSDEMFDACMFRGFERRRRSRKSTRGATRKLEKQFDW